MKTIITNADNTSRYFYSDDKQVNVKNDRIEVGDPTDLELIICDLNPNNSTLIEGVTDPGDWEFSKYNYVNGAWELCPDWIDPRIEN